MTAVLSDLVHEREPDPDALERERLIPMGHAWSGDLPKHSYDYPEFYEPFERVVCGTIEATIRHELDKAALDHSYTRRPRR